MFSGSTSPILFEDSQTSTENASMEVLGASRNDSKETNVGTEIGQSCGKNEGKNTMCICMAHVSIQVFIILFMVTLYYQIVNNYP
jgi:hypothetical protein